MPGRILIVEDTPSIALAYAAHIEAMGHAAEIAETGAAARALLAGASSFEAVLLDLQLPDCDGLELLASIPSLAATSSVIVVTSDGSINRAISAMRLGAYDFLVKPLTPERLKTTIRNALERSTLSREVAQAKQVARRDHFHGFVGQSAAMQAVYRAIENVADSKATVFVTGESGTGKEVTAEAIHRASGRRNEPFVAINCGAIPESLLESELFGHVRGAFTGAIENRPGAARAANGGTLFLDEICELDLKLQVKLLRFLQTGLVQPVGSNRSEPVDIRLVCATNRDPVEEVAAGRFREDLFYRLAVIPIELPPLRQRGNDLDLIAQTFLERYAIEEGKTLPPLSESQLATLHRHRWPGNVRELQNAIRRAVVMSGGREISLPIPQEGASPSVAEAPELSAGGWRGLTLDQIERLAIEQAIADADGNLPNAARNLGVSPSTLYRKRERWLSANHGVK